MDATKNLRPTGTHTFRGKPEIREGLIESPEKGALWLGRVAQIRINSARKNCFVPASYLIRVSYLYSKTETSRQGYIWHPSEFTRKARTSSKLF